MLTKRTIASLSQFLALLETDFVLVLCEKHGQRMSIESGALLTTMNRNFTFTDSPAKLLAIVEEIARTKGDLRSRVNPKYRFDERFDDLTRSLELDGYVISKGQLLPLDPSIEEFPALEDDLTKELQGSALPGINATLDKIKDSADSFRRTPPNYNACLNDIRIALESLAAAVAQVASTNGPPAYDPTKWGSVIAHLKTLGFLTLEEERGLAGVYGFVSPGSHRPLGLSDAEMARLGRHLALSMCWFLVKRYIGYGRSP